MRCVNCGNENGNTSKFCAVCGTPLESDEHLKSADMLPSPDGMVRVVKNARNYLP